MAYCESQKSLELVPNASGWFWLRKYEAEEVDQRAFVESQKSEDVVLQRHCVDSKYCDELVDQRHCWVSQ